MSEMEKKNASFNWYPGHMAKAKREMEESLKKVDMVIEIRDARIPLSSRNPLLEEMTQHKPRLIILSKADKADESITSQWISKLQNEGQLCLALDLIHGKNLAKRISEACTTLMAKKIARLKAKGLRNVEIKAMVTGIPNVGKSTLINGVSGKKAAQTADRPGVTKNLQWIKVSPSVALLDTPGVLWPKFEDQEVAFKLSVCGAISDRILPLNEICLYALAYLKARYPKNLEERYGVDLNLDGDQLLQQIARQRGWLGENGEVNDARTYSLLLKEIRDGLLGRITWEQDADGE